MPSALALSFTLALASPFSTGPLELVEPPEGGAGGDPTAAPAMAEEPSTLDPNDPYATTSPQPAEGPAAAPATTVPAQPIPEAKPPSKTGIGLMIGAGVAGGVGWTANIARIVRFEDGCRDAFETAQSGTVDEDVLFDPVDCFGTLLGNAGFTVLHWAGNWTAIGLAAGAGSVRGKSNAFGQAKHGRPNHNPLAFQVSGGVLLGAGVISSVLARGVGTFGLIGQGAQCTDFDCVNRTYATRIMWVQLSSSTIATGAGLLAYGVSLERRLNYYERVLQMQPTVSITPDFAGGGVAGRF